MQTVQNEKFRIEDLTQPIEGRVLCKDMYGYCLGGDPKKLLVDNSWKGRYFGTPQWNKNKAVLEWGLNREDLKGLDIEIVHFPKAYAPNEENE